MYLNDFSLSRVENVEDSNLGRVVQLAFSDLTMIIPSIIETFAVTRAWNNQISIIKQLRIGGVTGCVEEHDP